MLPHKLNNIHSTLELKIVHSKNIIAARKIYSTVDH